MFSRADPLLPYIEPRRSYMGDAGYDLFSAKDLIVAPGATVHVPVNTRVDFPPGWFGIISERSSQGVNGICTMGNVIDETYTGAIGVNLLNTRRESVIVHQGDKVGQLLLVPRFIDPREKDMPMRGMNGYGSTGVRA